VKRNQLGFTEKGNWYKGNLHSHTTNSDGKLTPGQAVKAYQEQGYHFLCLSEHDLYTDYRNNYNTEEFILLPGLEASAILLEREGSRLRKQVHHIHGILGTSQMQKDARLPGLKHLEGLTPEVYYGDWDSVRASGNLSIKLRERGYVTIYNHPIWSRVKAEEIRNTPGLTGVEIFNYNTVNESGTGYDTYCWDLMLREGRKVHAFASDDNHNEGRFPDSGGGYICVKAEKLSHDAIIESILAGNFYSSSGPAIYEWGIKEGSVYVECSPVNRINFIAGNYVNAGITVMHPEKEDILTSATYPMSGKESYVRVECVDIYGKTAWSNAMFLAGNGRK